VPSDYVNFVVAFVCLAKKLVLGKFLFQEFDGDRRNDFFFSFHI
jgi:hypothetical protein